MRVLLCCVHSLISVIDKLLTYIYTRAAATGFCWTFKLIREELMSSIHYRETWNSSKACRTCSNDNFNHSHAISVSFDFSEISSNEKLSKLFSLSGRVWKRFKYVTDGISHEKMTFRTVQVSSTRYFYFQYSYDARLLF
jgi:hypothetical protein